MGKKVNGTLTEGFLYRNQLNPVAQTDALGNVAALFVYGDKPNVPAYMVKGTTIYRIVSDYLGSVRMVVDASTGQIAQQLDYDAFGQVTADTNPGFQPFGYAGGLYDPDTGLVRFGARDYDAQIGRWTTKDPILFAGKQVSLYAYVGGDPINYTDPNGHELILGVIGGAIGGVAGGISGWLQGDSGSQWWVDVGAGALSGSLIGLTNGLSAVAAEGIGEGVAIYGGRAAASAGIEAARQEINCGQITSWGDVGIAGAGSLVGSSFSQLGEELQAAGDVSGLGNPIANEIVGDVLVNGASIDYSASEAK